MSDSIYLLQPDDSIIQINQIPYEQESDLQALLDRHPELLPGAQINPESPRRWLVVRSEAGVPSEEGGSEWWAVDHLLLDQDGIPTLVEVKRSSDTRIRREVVAQMLEYAANGTAYWRMETLRGWFEQAEQQAGRDPETTLTTFLEDAFPHVDGYWTRVEENLQAGRVRCIFVADVIPATLRRLVEFLNEHLDTVEVLSVEVPQYVADDKGVKALVPRLVGQTVRARAVKGTPVLNGRQWDEESFMAAVGERYGPEAVGVFQALRSSWETHADSVSWGRGKTDGSMAAVVWGGGARQVPFTAWTSGSTEINFEYLKTHVPFRDEGLRLQLLDRLNTIPGVQLPPDSIGRRPSVSWENLRGEESQQAFFDVMRWTMETIREAEP